MTSLSVCNRSPRPSTLMALPHPAARVQPQGRCRSPLQPLRQCAPQDAAALHWAHACTPQARRVCQRVALEARLAECDKVAELWEGEFDAAEEVRRMRDER